MHEPKEGRPTELIISCVETALKHVTVGKREGRTELTLRRGRRRKQFLDDFKETRRYQKLKEKAPDHTVWRNHFGRTEYGVNEWSNADARKPRTDATTKR